MQVMLVVTPLLLVTPPFDLQVATAFFLVELSILNFEVLVTILPIVVVQVHVYSFLQDASAIAEISTNKRDLFFINFSFCFL